MKTLYNSQLRLLIAFLGLLSFYSCSEDFPKNIESSNEVVLKSIKILNAGVDGNTVVEGTVNEQTKAVSFPRLDPETDFSAIRFEAEMSQGATLDKETYEIPFQEGDAEKSIIIKTLNNMRFREYVVTIRLRVPVFGADFENKTVYDFTTNPLGSPVYPTFVSLNTRGSGFDEEHVLIVTRASGGSHLLKVADLKSGTISPITLNPTGVAQGIYTVNTGAQINGHTYIANLSGGTAASPLKIYHWTDPNAAPDVIASLDLSTIPGSGGRHGDNISVNLDGSGNGYMYFGDNTASQSVKILRLKVTNYTTISEPVSFPTPLDKPGNWVNFNRVGTSSEYLYTGHEAPIAVVNDGGTVSYAMSRTSIPIRGQDARVAYFNSERYLIMTTGARSGSDPTVLYVYNITKGETIAEALELFESSGNVSPVFEYSLMGSANGAPTTQTAFVVKKDAEGNDETLTIYTATTDAGFVIIDFPKKQLDD